MPRSQKNSKKSSSPKRIIYHKQNAGIYIGDIPPRHREPKILNEQHAPTAEEKPKPETKPAQDEPKK